MDIFDTHCHLDFPQFDSDREQVIEQCNSLGINHILIPGVTVDNWAAVVTTASMGDGYCFALGLHPYFLQQHQLSDIDRLVAAINHHKPVAVGEIGLDYHVESLDKQKQIAIFEAQLDVAKSFDLPVVLHVRKAHDDVLKLLRTKKLKGGTVHAYSGSEQQAHQYAELGFYLGFGGSVTYERATKLRRLATKFPLEHIVLETDAPDLPPASKQHQRNSPCDILEVTNLIATLRNCSPEIIVQATTRNALKLFDLA